MSVRLARGVRVSIDAAELLITDVDMATGTIELRDEAGAHTTMTVDDFITHPHIEEVTARRPSVMDAAVERLDVRARATLSKRIAHVYEAETGYRSGTHEVALPHEPRPEFDPATTTLTQRREAKARELDNEHAIDAGTKMSVATLRRVAKALNDGTGLSGAVDRRHVRRSPGRHSINEQVQAACEEVFEKTREDSNRTHAARYLLVKQYMREVFGYAPGTEPVPSEKTVRRWFLDRHLPSELNGKARTRRSATSAPPGGFTRANPTRPGELVCIDTCSLDVLLTGTDFEGTVRGVVVMAVDWYSRSIVAIRVLQDAEQAIDVTFLLREIGRPKPMLPGWTDENRWPFVGLPEQVLTDVFGGDRYAGIPFVNAEAVVTDHGTTYKAHINVATATQQGVSILPARVRTGSDKQIVERMFRSLGSMLLQHLSGYRGTDASERGTKVDAHVRYSVQDIEDVATFWAVRIWQNHELSDARPDWCPEGTHSPNTLYEYGLAQTGAPLRALTSNDYYTLLPTVHVKVGSRGVHVRGLYYDGPALSGLRGDKTPSPYGGRYKGRWTVRYDPRDLRRVFFLDGDGIYQPLTWVGANRHTPCFNDRHATALTSLRRQRGISPHSQDALAEVLLTEILAVHEPVSQWSTLSPAARRTIKERSRVQRQEQMVERDQAASAVPRFADSFPTLGEISATTDGPVQIQDDLRGAAAQLPQPRGRTGTADGSLVRRARLVRRASSSPRPGLPTIAETPERRAEDMPPSPDQGAQVSAEPAAPPRPRTGGVTAAPRLAGGGAFFSFDTDALIAARAAAINDIEHPITDTPSHERRQQP